MQHLLNSHYLRHKMKQAKITRVPALFIFLIISAISCNKGFDTGWETDLLTPILHGELTIDNLVPDSIKEVNEDNSVDLVFQNTIFDLSITDLVEVPDTTVSATINIDSVKIDDKNMSQTISLGQIAEALQADGNILGTIIILANGSNLAIDPISGLSSGEQIIDATSFFETATFEAGYLDIIIKNDLPIEITDITFQLKNTSDGALIVEDVYPSILPGSFVSETYDLAGKTVDGLLAAEITSFNSPGSGGAEVFIDTSDNVLLQLVAHDMELYEATAIFPAQNLVNTSSEVEYFMGEGGPEITEMTLKSGNVVINVVNTIEDSISITYSLPYATSSTGEPVYFETVCPPAPPGGSITVSEDFPLAGYSVDLGGIDGNKANTFYQIFTATLDSSGEVRTLSKDDSIVVVYGLEDIVPLTLKGYVGTYHQEYSDNTSLGFNIVEFLDEGEIHFNDVNVNLTVTNGVGIDARFTINNLSATNTLTGEVLDLNAPGFIGVPIQVERAVENPFIPGETVIQLNNSNSNILDLLEMFPDKMSYDVDLDINPDGNIYNYQDFLLEDSRTQLTLDLELPLDILAENVTLRDTFDIDITTDEDQDAMIEDVQSLELTLIAENQFPLSAGIKIHFFDEFGALIDSVDFASTGVQAGILNPSCKVEEPKESILTAEFTGERINNILNAKNAEVIAVFNTPETTSCGETVKIYNFYKLNLNLTAHLNYNFSTKD